MPRRNYRDQGARRRHTAVFAEPESSEFELLITNGRKVRRVTVEAKSGVNAWFKATRSGRADESDIWWPIEVLNTDTGWSYGYAAH